MLAACSHLLLAGRGGPRDRLRVIALFVEPCPGYHAWPGPVNARELPPPPAGAGDLDQDVRRWALITDDSDVRGSARRPAWSPWPGRQSGKAQGHDEYVAERASAPSGCVAAA